MIHPSRRARDPSAASARPTTPNLSSAADGAAWSHPARVAALVVAVSMMLGAQGFPWFAGALAGLPAILCSLVKHRSAGTASGLRAAERPRPIHRWTRPLTNTRSRYRRRMNPNG
jgi:hypothetical protein